jgi:hypothetical protein
MDRQAHLADDLVCNVDHDDLIVLVGGVLQASRQQVSTTSILQALVSPPLFTMKYSTLHMDHRPAIEAPLDVEPSIWKL